MTHYQRPGLRQLSTPPTSGRGRFIYRSSDGQLFACIDTSIYYIDPQWKWTLLGHTTVNATNPVSMADNGVTLVIVDGTTGGWTVDLTSHAFQTINDSTGTFQGGTKADYLDTFLIFGPSPPASGSTQWISTMSEQVQFNALFVAGKTSYPDPLQTLIVNRHEIILLGQLKSEIWYDAGNAQLPFAQLPGSYIEHGTPAPYSVASSDISVFWLGQDLQGDGVVFRQRGYWTTRISNHALEFALRQIKKNGTLSDAVGYTYQQDGHYFYVLNFPSGDQTWVFDDSVGEPSQAWHQRGWTNRDGALHRDRVQSAAFVYEKNLGLDWETGQLYQLDPDYYVDTLDGVDYPIHYVRTFPHIGSGYDEQNRLVQADGRQIQYSSFMLDIECGTIPFDDTMSSRLKPVVNCRYSDDRGRTFTGSVQLELGAEGQYLTWPTLKGPLGRARDRVWEVEWVGNGQSALNGAWIDGRILHD